MPDLIICDPQLPDYAGLGTGRRIIDKYNIQKRTTGCGSHRSTEILQKSKCEELGVADHFTKPFNPVTLLESINNLISKKKNHAQNFTIQQN